MNQACKHCGFRIYKPKQDQFGRGFQWCTKFNTAIIYIEYCSIRNKISRSQDNFKKRNRDI